MVMDPVTAIGLASSVVALVEYGGKLLSTGIELYEVGGTLEEHVFLERTTNRLTELFDRIDQATPAASLGLAQLQNDGRKVAKELLDAMGKLKVKGAPSIRKSLWKALKVVHSKEKSQELVQRLDRLRSECIIHLEVDILENINLSKVEASKSFQKLALEQQNTLQTFIKALEDDNHSVEDLLLQQSKNLKDLISSENEQTRTLINDNQTEILDVVRSQATSNRTASSAEAAETRGHVATQHDETRRQVLASQVATESAIASSDKLVLRANNLAHEETQARTANLVQAYTTNARNAIQDTQQLSTDALEAESFRAQLELDARVKAEHLRTRDFIEEVGNQTVAGLTGILAPSGHSPCARQPFIPFNYGAQQRWESPVIDAMGSEVQHNTKPKGSWVSQAEQKTGPLATKTVPNAVMNHSWDNYWRKRNCSPTRVEDGIADYRLTKEILEQELEIFFPGAAPFNITRTKDRFTFRVPATLTETQKHQIYDKRIPLRSTSLEDEALSARVSGHKSTLPINMSSTGNKHNPKSQRTNIVPGLSPSKPEGENEWNKRFPKKEGCGESTPHTPRPMFAPWDQVTGYETEAERGFELRQYTVKGSLYVEGRWYYKLIRPDGSEPAEAVAESMLTLESAG